ncbi:hypothetical protein LguiB_033800 [Lonicera macranthoides]
MQHIINHDALPCLLNLLTNNHKKEHQERCLLDNLKHCWDDFGLVIHLFLISIFHNSRNIIICWILNEFKLFKLMQEGSR